MHSIGQTAPDLNWQGFTGPLQTRDPAADTYSDFPTYQASQVTADVEGHCLQIIADDGVLAACADPLCYATNPPGCDAAVAEQEQKDAGERRSTTITYVALGAAALILGYLVLR